MKSWLRKLGVTLYVCLIGAAAVLVMWGLLAASIQPAAAQTGDYTVKAVANGGTISGAVTFAGNPPPPRSITVAKDKEIAGAAAREVDVVKVTGGKLADVVVYLEGITSGKAWPELPEGGLVDQKGARFIPSSRVIHKGVKIPVKNSDPMMHNIHAYEMIGRARRTLFNRGQIANLTFNLLFDVKKNPYVKLECDAHNFMHEYLFVASNPYYSVTAEDGAFSITGVPAGDYTLVAWHPVAGVEKTTVTVAAGGSVSHEFAFSAQGG